MGTQRGASNAIPPLSNPSPAPTNDDAASSLPTAAAKAAEIAVKSPWANGGAHRRNSPVQNKAVEDKGSGKRTFEKGDSDGVTDHDQPEAKKVAIET